MPIPTRCTGPSAIPAPTDDGNVRAGDNLFTCSVIALDPNTGRRKWHYQFTPNDSHDWDSTEDVILVDRVFQGQPRKLLLHADRNGMFYVLDRTDGKLLLGKAFVRQTWNTGFDANGRPKIVPNSDSQPEGSIPVFPRDRADQFPSAVVQSGHRLAVSDDRRFGQRYIRTPSEYRGREAVTTSGRAVRGLGEPAIAAIKALDPETGDVKWTVPAQPRLARGRSARDGGRRGVRRDARRQPDRPERPYRSRAVALPNRREPGGSGMRDRQ